MEFLTRLIVKKEVAKDTVAFHFQKPAEFAFQAGQYVKIYLINPPETDEEGDSRLFSIASAPHEDNIMITTRMRDTAFKRVLKTQPEGYEVRMKGPFGVFTLHEDSSIPAVFLVGGIGITPFRSIILDTVERKLPHKMVLFYANHAPDDAAFLQKLQTIAQSSSQFTFIPVMTRDETWEGEKAHIDENMIKKYVSDISNGIFYTAGPPKMVETMKGILARMNIDEARIKSEDFDGY